MECTAKSNIEATAGKVREASFIEKNSSTEEIVNKFLDEILNFKSFIKSKVSHIEAFVVQLEELTWVEFKSLDDDTLKVLNDVISGTRDWATSLNRNYSNCIQRLKGKVTIEELEELKNVIDDLNEAADDLEKAAFIYPNDEEFKSVTLELEKL